MNSAGKVKTLRYGALLLVLAAALWFKFLFEPSYERRSGPYETTAITVPVRPGINRRTPPDTSNRHGIERDLWSAPASNWLSNERSIAESSLRSVDVDLLILPVQGDKNAFDPIERSLISRLVSDRIAQSAENAVANPTFVLRYIGSHRSTFPTDDVQALARLTRAERILVLNAEHDRDGQWELSASLNDTYSESTIDTKTWSNLSYDDSEPPSASFVAILDDVVEFATGQSTKRIQTKPNFNADQFQFPDSLADLTAKSRTSALHAAAYLQLIGMLHPRGSFNEVRYQLFERSLVELQKVSPRAPYYRYFKSRAYAYLERRPAAVTALGEPSNTHEKALLAALNGNLSDLQQHVAKMGTSALDFMAWKDLQEIEYRYVDPIERDTLERFTQAHPVWAPFIQRSLLDYEEWANYSAATIKLGLEELLPAEVISLESQLAKQVITGEFPSELDLTRLLWRHLEAFEAEEIPRWASDRDNFSNVSALDILDLAKTTAVANHLREIEKDLTLRVIPEAALKEINEFDSLFSGNPAVTLMKGRALEAMVEDSVGAEKENLILLSAETLLNGYAWTGQLTVDAIDVARKYNDYLNASSYEGAYIRPSSDLSHYSRRYFEWPKGLDWYRKKIPNVEVYKGALQKCVDYSWTSFWCLRFRIQRLERIADTPELVRSEILTAYADRFAGNPQRAEFEIENARISSDESAEVRLLKSQINAGSTDSSMYYALGRAYKRRGDYQSAQDVWLSYPGFQSGDLKISVADSNYADKAGSMLFWIGQHELALPLLEIAAASGTGSGASMSSAARVSLIIGDLESAEGWSAARVRRYDSKHGLRDLLQIMHIRGQSELAWSVFDQVQATRQDAQMWSGALVGHRMASASIGDIAEWIKFSNSRKAAVAETGNSRQSVNLAARYLLLAGTMDRVPGPQLTKAVSEAHTRAQPRYLHREEPRKTENAAVFVQTSYVQYDNGIYWHDDLVPSPRDEWHAENDQDIENRFTLLADAMTAFLNEDFDRSFELFNETAYFYYLDEFLPYYAFSAAAIGHAEHLPTALSAREQKLDLIRQKEKFDTSELGYRYDEDLTYAVLAAFEDRHEDAIRYLRQALNNRPYIGQRAVYPMYQIVDLADRLYERTGEDAYREFALDLSRRHTVVLPMYSWAYFIVAKHSQSVVERINATASGLKLDPLSHRATQLPEDLINEARKVLDTRGAPYLNRTSESVSRGA